MIQTLQGFVCLEKHKLMDSFGEPENLAAAKAFEVFFGFNHIFKFGLLLSDPIDSLALV